MKAILSCTAILGLMGAAWSNDAVRPDAPVTYERDIRPILKSHCFQCHGEDPGHIEARLDLRLRRLMLRGGKSGAVIVPGKHDASLLYKRIAKEEMPPDGKHPVPKDALKRIARWIDAGAPTARPEPEKPPEHGEITPEERAFWSFQPIRTPEVPKVKGARIRTAVDAFLLKRMSEKGLSFGPDADKRTLARRASFDLTGLPPTPAEVSAFLADTAPDAYDRLIDRLLASAHYGERWGRHWLDVAGYADSEGYDEKDTVRQDAYRYRDYVIRSFNADKPFDVFIREQLAGDELVRPPHRNLSAQDIDRLTATGFLRMAADGTANAKGQESGIARNRTVADTIQIVSTSLLGMTVACAQCHDHRYDPIPQADYYRFRAIFEPAFDCEKWRIPKSRRVSLYTDEDRKKAASIEKEAAKVDAERKAKEREYIDRTFENELKKVPAELHEKARAARKTPRSKRTAEQKRLLKEFPSLNVSAGSLYLYDPKAAADLKKIAARAAKVRAKKPKEEFLRVLTEIPGRMPATRVHYRGDHEQPKEEVGPSDLTVVSAKALPKNDSKLPTTGRRLAFAKRLTDGTHPLVARVLVNRIWMHHFGTGLVETPGDFGRLGSRPSHPDLLDWLAQDFMNHGWKVKRLHKLLMRSTAYRQSSKRDETRNRIDPDNRLYSRMNVRRLEAEMIRDATLAVSGRLNAKMFGPSVPVMADEVGQFVIGKENLNAGRPGAVIAMNGEEFRRSLYVQVRRSRPLAVLDMFDAPVMEPNCELRNFSTVAPQALMLMNSRFTTSQADDFARRVRREAGASVEDRIRLAWSLAYAAAPSEGEAKEAAAFVKAQADHFRKNPPPAPKPKKGGKAVKPDPDELAMATFCQALLSSNRFLYID